MKRNNYFIITILIIIFVLCGCGKDVTARDMMPTADGQEMTTANSDINYISKGNVQLINDSGEENNKKENTVLIYVIGSDLESKGGAASEDFEEIKNSGIITDNTNVVIFTGGCKKWFTDISNQTNTVLLLDAGDIHPYAKTDEAMNMADASALLTFIDYAYEEFPAEHYSLIFWDHGGGPILGYGADELNGKDSLTLDEMEAALYNSHFKNSKFDWVGFDACLMSSIEIAAILDDYADYLIASQETEPGDGWDYAFMEVLNNTSDPEQIADRILCDYLKYYSNNVGMKADITLACMKLSEAKATVEAVDVLFAKMQEDLDKGDYYDISAARDKMKCFGAMNGKGNAFDLVDLKDCAQKLSDRYKEEGEALSRQIDKLVVNNNVNICNAFGVSIYFPFDNIRLYNQYKDVIAMNGLKGAGAYNRFVLDFISTRDGVDTISTGYTLNSDTTEDEIIIQLSHEEMDNMLGAYYTIIERKDSSSVEDGYGYVPVVENVRIEPEENGVIRITKNPKVYGVRDTNSKLLMGMEQITSDLDRNTYKTILSNVHEMTLDSVATDGDWARVNLNFTEINDTYEIQNVTLGEDTEIVPVGKNTVNLEKWGNISDVKCYCKITYDEQGKMMPFSEWEKLGFYAISSMILESTINIFSTNTSELTGEYYCQLMIENKDGSKYATDLFGLTSGVGYTEESVETKKGEMIFLIHDGEAKLVKYRGEDKEIIIPSRVAGTTVTTIGVSAFAEFTNYGQDTIEKLFVPDSVSVLESCSFAGLRNLKEIKLSSNITTIPDKCFEGTEHLSEVDIPDSVTRIGIGAFYWSGIKKITIPAKVESIGCGAFSGCGELAELFVDADNNAYYVSENILYTSDGRTLVAAPGGVAGINEIVIPKGVEVIDKYAFYGRDNLTDGFILSEDNLQSVVFPSTLKKIDDFAFVHTDTLKCIEFPESLEYIGTCNFSGYYTSRKNDEITIHIGKNVRFIGKDCFSAYRVTEYSVDEANVRYSEKDGNIMNASGEVVEFKKALSKDRK